MLHDTENMGIYTRYFHKQPKDQEEINTELDLEIKKKEKTTNCHFKV